jgi:uncharacterized protein (DUF169 family)
MDLKQINDAFTQYLRPQSYPLAIRMCASETELPEKVRLPKRDMDVDISLCHAVGMARRYGWAIAIDKTVSCYVPIISLGFAEPPADMIDGTFQESLNLRGMRKEQAGAAIRDMPKLPYGKYSHVLIAPIERATFEPHVFMLYASPAQIWVLLSAYLVATGKSALDTRLASGAGCTTYITKTILTDEAQFVLVGTGERIGPHPQDHECAFSIPASKIEKTVEALEKNVRTGVFRYPVPTFMRYNSQHPPGYDKMRSRLLGEDRK